MTIWSNVSVLNTIICMLYASSSISWAIDKSCNWPTWLLQIQLLQEQFVMNQNLLQFTVTHIQRHKVKLTYRSHQVIWLTASAQIIPIFARKSGDILYISWLNGAWHTLYEEFVTLYDIEFNWYVMNYFRLNYQILMGGHISVLSARTTWKRKISHN